MHISYSFVYHDLYKDIEARPARQQQQANANAAAEAALRAQREETTRRAGHHRGVVRCAKILNRGFRLSLFPGQFSPPDSPPKIFTNYYVASPLFDGPIRLCTSVTQPPMLLQPRLEFSKIKTVLQTVQTFRYRDNCCVQRTLCKNFE